MIEDPQIEELLQELRAFRFQSREIIRHKLNLGLPLCICYVQKTCHKKRKTPISIRTGLGQSLLPYNTFMSQTSAAKL